MTSIRRTLLAGLLLTLAAPALASCTGGARRESRAGAGGATRSDGGQPAPAAEAGDVVLTDADLAKMDGWVKRRRWILGDDVDIVASREYFGPIVSITERIGVIRREDTDQGGDAISTMTFTGPKEAIDVQTAPRVFIGTGLSVMARRRLTLRLLKTHAGDASVPVRIRINASGKASTGVGDQVAQRADALVMGARIFRGPDGQYAFEGN